MKDQFDIFIEQARNGFIDALFFAAGSEVGDEFYGCDDVSVSAEFGDKLAEAIKHFVDSNMSDVVDYLQTYDASQFGHDLFLSSYGAGTGFFDRGSDGLFDRLESAAFTEFPLTSHIEVDDYNTLVIHQHYSIDK